MGIYKNFWGQAHSQAIDKQLRYPREVSHDYDSAVILQIPFYIWTTLA